MLDLFDENGFKTLEALKDNLGLGNLKFLSYHGLKQPLLQCRERNSGMELKSQEGRTPLDKHERTPLDFIPCVIESLL